MASVTPAAPAAQSVAPPAGPADAAAPGLGTPVPDSGITPEADARAPRLARPLKPIPSLPGVFPDDDPFPLPPSRTAATSDPAKQGEPGPARGPDGRFLAPSSATDGAGEHALEAVDPKPASARYKFAGEEFASQEAAEQNFKSLRGQFRPIQALARQLGGIEKIQTTLESAADSARAWKAEAERLANGAPATSTSTAEPTAPAEAGIDWALHAEIKRLATESGEPWKADQWLAERQDEIVQARVQRILDERLAPLAEQEQEQQLVSRVEDLWSGLAQYTNSDGSPAFPELNDPVAAHEIGLMWHAMGLPAEAALTPQGAIAAIAVYEKAKRGRSQANPATQPLAAPAAPQVPTDAHAAADLGDGRGPRAMRVADASSPSAEAAAILAGLRQVNSGNRAATLGFEP